MNQAIEAFLDRVCEQVKCREVHDEIRLELGGHLEELVERYVGTGFSEIDAVRRALADMGDPVLIGQQLNETHQPRTDWGLIAATILLVVLGGWAMFAVDVSESSALGMNLFGAKLQWSAVGLSLGAVVLFVDYRRLRRYSFLLYGVTLAASVLLSLWATRVNGQPRGLGHTPMLFAVALAGLFTVWDWDRPRTLVKAVALFAAPLLVYLNYAALLGQFVAVCIVLLFLSRPRRWQAAVLAGSGFIAAAAGALHIWMTPYLRMRVLTILFPTMDPLGSGYQVTQSRLAIQQAGRWGQGVTANLDRVPDVQGKFVFPYLVYTLGWAAGIAICLLIAFFLGRMLLASRQVKDPYGSYLVAVVGTLFAYRFGWNVLMAVGALPVASVDLPFISQGMQAAMQLALVGLVLGVFRRKDMGRSPLLPG